MCVQRSLGRHAPLAACMSAVRGRTAYVVRGVVQPLEVRIELRLMPTEQRRQQLELDAAAER
jgi:hypothetical protein